MQITEIKLVMLKPQASKTRSGLCQPKSAQAEPNMSQHTSTVTHVHVLICMCLKRNSFSKVCRYVYIEKGQNRILWNPAVAQH